MKGETRGRAAKIILRWIEEGAFPDRQMAEEKRDRAFLMEVVYGAIKWKRQLDWLMDCLTERKPDDVMRAHLLASLYQVFHMDSVEPYALVSESVEAMKMARGKSGAGFLNAVLRRALREKEPLIARLRREAPLAVRESHPDFWVDKCVRRLGTARTAELLVWNNARPAVTVRVQRSRVAFSEVASRWTKEGIPFEAHPAYPERCFVLGKGVEVTHLPGWQEGWVTVQDPSTLVAVDLLDPAPGQRILDACAAPGGKLADIADRALGAAITALDVSHPRLALVRDNLARLKIGGVTILQGDLAHAGTARILLKGGLFDCVLIDAPCTNTGVFRRRPDARWRFSPSALDESVRTQKRLLDAVARLLKDGGRLVYSTCSIEPEENSMLVAAWLRAHPGWKLETERLWLPGEHGTDGAYAASIAIDISSGRVL